jgi:hypothetical protein
MVSGRSKIAPKFIKNSQPRSEFPKLRSLVAAAAAVKLTRRNEPEGGPSPQGRSITVPLLHSENEGGGP